MRLQIKNDDYHVYIANNVTMVKKMHDDHQVCKIEIIVFETKCFDMFQNELYF